MGPNSSSSKGSTPGGRSSDGGSGRRGGLVVETGEGGAQ